MIGQPEHDLSIRRRMRSRHAARVPTKPLDQRLAFEGVVLLLFAKHWKSFQHSAHVGPVARSNEIGVNFGGRLG